MTKKFHEWNSIDGWISASLSKFNWRKKKTSYFLLIWWEIFFTKIFLDQVNICWILWRRLELSIYVIYFFHLLDKKRIFKSLDFGKFFPIKKIRTKFLWNFVFLKNSKWFIFFCQALKYETFSQIYFLVKSKKKTRN